MESHLEDSDPVELFLQKEFRCTKSVAIINRVKNLDDYQNHIIQDYYLAFDVSMQNFNMKFLKQGDLNSLKHHCEFILPMVRVRTSRIRTLSRENSIQLRSKFIKINESNRSKEYVKRLLDELHAHVQVLWEDEKDIALYRFMEMLKIKVQIRALTLEMNRIIAFHRVTKNI